jgi:hypothetical protein
MLESNKQKFYNTMGFVGKPPNTLTYQYNKAVAISVVSINNLPYKFKIEPVLLKGTNIANVMITDDYKYVTCGDIPISSDGEFRNNFVNMELSRPMEHNMVLITKFYRKYKSFINTTVDEDTIIGVLYITSSAIAIEKTRGYPTNYHNKVYDLFRSLVNKIEIDEKIVAFASLIGYGKNKAKALLTAQGTKFIPLYIDDLNQVKTYRENVNQEIEIGLRIRNMVFNCVVLGCPSLVKWFIFKVEDLRIFSSDEILENYKKSKTYLKNIKKLYEAQDMEGSTETIKTFKAKVRAPISFAEKKMILSNYAMLLVSDYSGRTFADYVISSIENGRESFVSQIEDMKSFIFQITYTLYCFNKHIGMIHSDLHFNNITVRKREIETYGQYVVGEKSYYIMNNKIYHIIDFGRVLQKPSQVIMSNHVENNYYTGKLTKFFGRVMPETYMKNKDEIDTLAFTDGDNLFKILEALDIFFVASNIREVLMKYLNPEVAEFIKNLSNFILDWVLNSMSKFLKREPIPDKNINRLIIEKFYTDYTEPKEITYYCNSNNEVKLEPGDFKFEAENMGPIKFPKKQENGKNFIKKIMPILEEEISSYYNH